MFANYLKITLRNLLGNKLYSAINLLGLAVGLASTLLIGLFVLDELSYDKQWQDADRIYRISSDFPHQGIFMAANAPQTAPLLKLDFPEIEHAARLFGGQALLRNGETAFYESNIRFADNEFFDIFKLQWLAGDPAQALAKPFTIVLTESIAKKYFGNEPALGKTLLLENKAPMLVTGVIRDLPHNTHLDLSVIGSLESLRNIAGPQFFENWGSNNFHTYVKLKPGVNIATVTQRFDEFLNKHINPNATTIRGMTATAIGDIHLHSNRQFEMTPPGSMSTVYTFGAAALFILMIACFNFMNLATARSTRRGQEVGIRKTLGASRSEIARQFVGESVLLTLLAAVLGLVLVELVLPYFNALLGKSLDLKVLLDGRVFALLAAAVVIVGLFAGSYPAFFLSAFKPVQVLRSVLASTGSLAFRNTLVILQFAIAIVLVVSSLVVILQMRHARSIELGFQKDQILIMAGSPTAGMGPQWDAMRQALLRLPGVEAVSASSQTPLVNNTNSMGLRPQGQQDMSLLPFLYIDYDFFRAYRVPVLAGREFDEDHPGDRLLQSGKHDDTHKAGVILNQLAAAQLGWTPDQAVGQEVQISMSEKGDPAIVVGVVANSLFESAHNALKPMMFTLPPRLDGNVAMLPKGALRLSGNDVQGTLQRIDQVWKQFLPDFPVSHYFLDDTFNAMYLAETRQGSVLNAFSLLAIVIACMGLYGLASFNAQRRMKEIGVRKVMGGSVWSIVLLLTNDFSKLVLIANVVAWPVAYYAMHNWLQNFAYRIDLTPLVFIGSGLIALCIAWVTVGGTAAKAASQKPVLALRYE